ncbi:MAG TPA: hypothetical protein DCQ33_15310 [Nitrospira sp.]|nr:hypothetical protein [Nitrospira sp.]
MLIGIATLLGGIWDAILSGWDWVKRLARRIAGDIAHLFRSLAGETASNQTPAQAAPAVARSETSAKASLPVQAPKSAPAPAPVVPPPAPAETVQQAPAPVSERSTTADKSDETALARMLASDDSPREVKFIRGWIAVQRQRSRKVSMFELLTRGLGYGPRNRKPQGQLSVYASTAQEPSETDRAVAHSLLAGTVVPSAAIRMHKPGQLIERGKELTDAKILRKQADLKEGIYGRIQGTDWLVLSADAPAIAPKKGQTAADALDGVPTVPVMDAAAQNKQAAA